MRIRLAVPDDLNDDEKEAVMNAALEAVTLANAPLMARGKVPTADRLIAGGARWRPEPPGDEHFDLASTIARRGHGDCDDWAPAWAASLRATGKDPEARAFVRKSGPKRWHAVVQRSNGRIEDPSRMAGMGSVGADDYGGALWPTMFGDRLAMAAMPLRRGWAGRVDVPSLDLPMLYSALTHASTPRQAIVGACRGVGELAFDDADAEDLLRVAGMHDLLVGVPYDELSEAMDHVGFGFGALLPAATSLAAPLLSKILPGGGGGGKAAAPGGGGGGGGYGPPSGATMTCPGGPIIVRF